MTDQLRKLQKKIESKPKYWVDQIVSFPIYSFSLEGKVDSSKVIETTLSLQTDISNRQDILVDGYQSQYYKKTDKTFSNLITEVENSLNSLDIGKYEVDHYWFIIYKKGTKHFWHKHLPFEYSAAYYPNGTQNYPIIFRNQSNKDLEINAGPNSLLVFPSNLLHSVSDCETDNQRIVFSFNFVNCNQISLQL
jgi:hypothetical protein